MHGDGQHSYRQGGPLDMGYHGRKHSGAGDDSAIGGLLVREHRDGIPPDEHHRHSLSDSDNRADAAARAHSVYHSIILSDGRNGMGSRPMCRIHGQRCDRNSVMALDINNGSQL